VDGLYVVMNLDEAGTRSPAYRISPDKLRKIEAEKSEAETREDRKKRIIALTKELSEVQEGIPFSGINPESYPKLKANDVELEGLCTPIDDLIQRFEKEGIKVVFGNDPESGNVFILPFGSNDVESDSVFPKHLQIDESMDSRLKELILASRS